MIKIVNKYDEKVENLLKNYNFVEKLDKKIVKNENLEKSSQNKLTIWELDLNPRWQIRFFWGQALKSLQLVERDKNFALGRMFRENLFIHRKTIKQIENVITTWIIKYSGENN